MIKFCLANFTPGYLKFINTKHSKIEMGQLQERIVTTTRGSITSVQAIYVPADDLTDPAPSTVFEHLDATTVLSRKITQNGIYPAVDPLESTSTNLNPEVVGVRHHAVATKVNIDFAKFTFAEICKYKV